MEEPKTIMISINPDLIEAVKLKEKRQVGSKSASGVVDWVLKKYLNPEGVTGQHD